MIRILIVEDKYHDSVEARRVLEQAVGEVSFERLESETEFRRWLEDPRPDPVDLIVLDMMLPWTVPSHRMEPAPEDVKNTGYQQAGERCYKLLRGHERYARVPVILLTATRIETPPEGAVCVEKLSRERLGAEARRLLDKPWTQAAGN